MDHLDDNPDAAAEIDAADDTQFKSLGVTVVRGQHPTHAIEKIIRERIFDSLYWKEKCFAVNAASVLDLAADMNHIGGTFSNQRPTEFLCLALKLLQIQPEIEIIMEYIQQEDFKYIRALGAFYLRLVGSAVTVFQALEPLLNDFRKLRFRKLDGSYELTYMDEFVDRLLTEERVCDTILPRITSRDVLEEQDLIEPRQSVLQADLQEPSDSEESDISSSTSSSRSRRYSASPYSPAGSQSRSPSPAHERIKGGKLRLKKTPVGNENNTHVSKTEPAASEGSGGFREEMSFEETNKMRIALGMKPLKR